MLRRFFLSRLYPAGCRVRLVRTDDPYTSLVSGAKGSVAFIDRFCTIIIRWDNGQVLGMIPFQDKIRRSFRK